MSNEELVMLIQDGIDVNKNLDQLYKQNIPLIRNIVYPYSNRCDIEDLMQEAFFGLVSAVNTFNHEKGVKFMTYAPYKIKITAIKYYYANAYDIRVPENKFFQISRYKHFIDTFVNENDCMPDEYEIMEAMQITKSDLRYLQNLVKQMRCLHLDAPVDGVVDIDLGETIAADYDLEDDVIECITNENKVRELDEERFAVDLWEAVNSLSEIERNVIVDKYRDLKPISLIKASRILTDYKIKIIERRAFKELSKNESVLEMAQFYEYDGLTSYKYGKSRFENSMTSSTEFIALKHIEIEQDILKMFGALQ